jgi:hypothetical protein
MKNLPSGIEKQRQPFEVADFIQLRQDDCKVKTKRQHWNRHKSQEPTRIEPFLEKGPPCAATDKAE